MLYLLPWICLVLAVETFGYSYNTASATFGEGTRFKVTTPPGGARGVQDSRLLHPSGRRDPASSCVLEDSA